jgi:hypothetical protein
MSPARTEAPRYYAKSDPMPLLLTDFDLRAFEAPRIVQQAEAALAHTPRTITSVVNPRSAGGPHDFSSEGDYWWPDPANPGGAYIRRDGETNPDNFVAHRELMLAMATDLGAIVAAFEIRGEERFSTRARAHLRTWFIDPAARMNPNLQYAQAIQGVATGRGIGIIDTVHLAEVALAIVSLREKGVLPADEDAALTAWFRDYLDWIRTHPYGLEESRTDNNHAVCWTLQCATFAKVTRDEGVLEDCRRRFKEILLPGQMAPSEKHPNAPPGSFPRELGRTKPYGYSIFNLDIMTALAKVLSSTAGENLVTFTLEDGRSLIQGVEFLAPFLADKSQWPYARDVQYWDDWPVRQPCLLFAALATGREDWLELWKRFEPDPQVYEIRRNFPVRQPVLWVRDDGK